MTESILSGAVATLPPGRYEIPVRGASMLPTLREGDVLSVVVPPGDPGIGDLLLLRHGNVTFAHRFVGRIGGRFLTKGDAHAGLDGWACAAGDVVGRVAGVRRESPTHEWSLESPGARLLARWLGLVGLATGSLFALARRLDSLVTRHPESGPCRRGVQALNRTIFRVFVGRAG